MYYPHPLLWKYPPHEQTALEHLLLGDLRDLLDEQPDEDGVQWLLIVLDALLDLLPEKFGHEEDGGYLSEVIDEFPTWDARVHHLRRQHTVLYRQLRQLREHVGRKGPSVALGDQITAELRDWMESLETHDHEESDLLQTALYLEIGGGD